MSWADFDKGFESKFYHTQAAKMSGNRTFYVTQKFVKGVTKEILSQNLIQTR